MFYIYKITNKLNNESYIGFTRQKNPSYRFSAHHKLSKNGSATHLHRAMRKYGIENFSFEVLKEGNDCEWGLKVEEPYYISLWRPEYNMTLGGDGVVGYCPSYESLERRRISSLGIKNHFYGKKHSAETKKLIGAKSRLRVPSTAELAKRSLSVSAAKRKLWHVVSPMGNIFVVSNLKEFCKENSICYGNLCSVGRRERNHANGWKMEHHG